MQVALNQLCPISSATRSSVSNVITKAFITMNNMTKHAGAALASTPAQSGQRCLPKSKTKDLIAPSLAKLPNALDAEYWLNRIKVQEDLGNYQVNRLFAVSVGVIDRT